MSVDRLRWQCLYPYYAICALQGLAGGFIAPVWQVFLAERSINVLQIGLLGAIFEGTILLAEVPSGGWADWWGRVPTVAVGLTIAGLSRLLFGLSTAFMTFAIAEIMYGFGHACMSGAVEAWVADSTSAEDTGTTIRSVFATGRSFLLGFLIVSTLVSGMLFNRFGPLVFYLSAGAYLASGLLMVVVAREPQQHDRTGKLRLVEGLALTYTTCREGVGFIRTSSLIMMFFAATALVGFAEDVVDRYWQLNLTDVGWDPAIFGLLVATETFLGMILTNLVARTAISPMLALFILESVRMTCLVALATYNPALALAGTVLFRSIRRGRYPVFMDYLNSLVSGKVRATVISLNSFVNSAGEIVAGVVFGIVALRFGLRTAFVLAALVCAPACMIYLLMTLTPGRAAHGRSTTRS